MLESPKGFDELAKIGVECVGYWRTGYPYSLVYEGNGLDDMKKVLRHFLKRLREQFLPIVLINLNKEAESGSFTRGWFDQKTWMDAAKAQCRVDGVEPTSENIMLRWDPRESGKIHLNLLVSGHFSLPRKRGIR